MSSTLADQSSVTRFIEQNWLGGQRIGGGSMDGLAGKFTNMFNFAHPNFSTVILNPATGEVVH